MTMLDIIAFDADDTLWHMESLFHLTHEKYAAMLSHNHSAKWIEKKLFETEMRNLKHFGYGVKGFTLSMIETAIELTEGRIKGNEIQKIIELGKQMLKAPVQLLEHAEDTIKTLSTSYPLMILTKGDLFDQESKIARSGLSTYFKYIEIRTQKTKDTYKAVLKKHNIDAQRFLMVGNSMRSDILPVLELGGYAVFIPYPFYWEHEKITDTTINPGKYPRYIELKHIGQLPQLVYDLITKDRNSLRKV
jgi:putative hydrolase of the HAD superfamily